MKKKVQEAPEISYVANLSRGPILITAPHSALVKRGGGATNTKLRTHWREHWASTIVLMLAQAIEELEDGLVKANE
jgi:hypothetical protein